MFFSKEKPVKKPTAEIEDYKAPVISVEHENAVYFSESFSDSAAFKAR